MQVLDEIAKVLHTEPDKLEKDSLKSYLEKELLRVETNIYQIGCRHGIKSILELDEKLKKGEAKEEDIREDFMELDRLESEKDELLEALRKL